MLTDTKIIKEIPLKPLLCKGFFISEIWGADHSADHRGVISIQKMWYLLLQQTCAAWYTRRIFNEENLI